MKITNIHDVKTNLSRYLLEIEAGKEIIIGRYGRPVARIVPFVSGAPEYRLGGLKGQIFVDDDFDAANARVVANFEGNE